MQCSASQVQQFTNTALHPIPVERFDEFRRKMSRPLLHFTDARELGLLDTLAGDLMTEDAMKTSLCSPLSVYFFQ